MPIYEIEQYEVHVQRFRIEADSEADAVARLLQGGGDPLDLTFVNIADDMGMSVAENPDLACELFERGVLKPDDTLLPSVRSVSVVEVAPPTR